MATTHLSAKRGVGLKDVPEVLINKKIVLSPPKTEFKIQDYPLKRMQRGLSGWDWQTEASDEYDLHDKVTNCKPTASTFSKLFPSRNFKLYPQSRTQQLSIDLSPLPNKEFNIKTDRISAYRESMLKAQQLFKMQ